MPSGLRLLGARRRAQQLELAPEAGFPSLAAPMSFPSRSHSLTAAGGSVTAQRRSRPGPSPGSEGAARRRRAETELQRGNPRRAKEEEELEGGEAAGGGRRGRRRRRLGKSGARGEEGARPGRKARAPSELDAPCEPRRPPSPAPQLGRLLAIAGRSAALTKRQATPPSASSRS